MDCPFCRIAAVEEAPLANEHALAFPDASHTFSIPDDEFAAFLAQIGQG